MVDRLHVPFGDPGGAKTAKQALAEAGLRADLCEIANLIDYRHGTKIVDAILAKYTLKERS